jgi:nitrogen fixation protein FixH
MNARPMLRFTGRTVLALFVGFFGVIFLVNGAFIWFATQSWHGLDTDDAYRKGLDYNATLARAEAQKVLGWRAEVSLDGARPVVRLFDRDGRPLGGLAVTGVARRPVDEHADRALVLVGYGDGAYRADSDLPAHGQWDLRVEVARRDGPPFLIEQRLWLPPQNHG